MAFSFWSPTIFSVTALQHQGFYHAITKIHDSSYFCFLSSKIVTSILPLIPPIGQSWRILQRLIQRLINMSSHDFGQMFWHCRETCGRCGDLPPCKIVSIKSKLGSGYYEWSSFCDCVEDDQCGNLLKIGYLKCDQGYTAEECPFSCGKC